MRVTLPIVGPGSQVEDETLAYMEMPRGMATYRAPLLPEREELGQLGAATHVLRSVLDALDEALHGAAPAPIGIAGLSAKERGLVNQVLGEGEVSALVHVAGEAHARVCVQESVFAGVWRVLGTSAGGGPPTPSRWPPYRACCAKPPAPTLATAPTCASPRGPA